MVDLIIGAVAMASFFLLAGFVRKQELRVAWWGWLLTVLGILLAVLTLETIIGFLAEGAEQAALVIGLVLMVITIIWGVLLQRFVFKKAV